MKNRLLDEKINDFTVVDVETKFADAMSNVKIKKTNSDEEFSDKLFERQGISAFRTNSNKLQKTIF